MGDLHANLRRPSSSRPPRDSASDLRRLVSLQWQASRISLALRSSTDSFSELLLMATSWLSCSCISSAGLRSLRSWYQTGVGRGNDGFSESRAAWHRVAGRSRGRMERAAAWRRGRKLDTRRPLMSTRVTGCQCCWDGVRMVGHPGIAGS